MRRLLVAIAVGMVSWSLVFQAGPAAAGETVTPELVQVIDTSGFSTPIPDPTGLDFSSSGRLLVADSEVEEIPALFEGRNVFEVTTGGALVGGFKTTRFSDEPVGLARKGRTLFLCDDNTDEVFTVRPGRDRRYGTRDDKVTSFNTRAFGSRDPEGIAFGARKLFVLDGMDAEVYRLSPGRNRVFDGVRPRGDDRVKHFDVAGAGLEEPEGIGFDRGSTTLFIVSPRRGSDIIQTTMRGQVLTVIDGSALNIRSAAGVAFGPRSSDPSLDSLYIADRGVDNQTDPQENDGKIYEIAF